MRTPGGIECQHFYGNYYRGRQHEECRLIIDPEDNKRWSSKLCQTCPVPDILRANSCPNMNLTIEIKNTFLGLKQKCIVTANCSKTHDYVKEPEVGCGQCHPMPAVFLGKDK
jgi:hypothetical protein